MVNRSLPHVLVLPEDDANRQIANGFLLNLELNERAIQILPVAGGWLKVVDAFENVHAREMKRYDERRIVLLIDFDGKTDRLNDVKMKIPAELQDRVFVLGVFSEPEKLKASMKHKKLEDIGMALSQDCSDNTQKMWGT